MFFLKFIKYQCLLQIKDKWKNYSDINIQHLNAFQVNVIVTLLQRQSRKSLVLCISLKQTR